MAGAAFADSWALKRHWMRKWKAVRVCSVYRSRATFITNGLKTIKGLLGFCLFHVFKIYVSKHMRDFPIVSLYSHQMKPDIVVRQRSQISLFRDLSLQFPSPEGNSHVINCPLLHGSLGLMIRLVPVHQHKTMGQVMLTSTVQVPICGTSKTLGFRTRPG